MYTYGLELALLCFGKEGCRAQVTRNSYLRAWYGVVNIMSWYCLHCELHGNVQMETVWTVLWRIDGLGDELGNLVKGNVVKLFVDREKELLELVA